MKHLFIQNIPCGIFYTNWYEFYIWKEPVIFTRVLSLEVANSHRMGTFLYQFCIGINEPVQYPQKYPPFHEFQKKKKNLYSLVSSFYLLVRLCFLMLCFKFYIWNFLYYPTVQCFTHISVQLFVYFNMETFSYLFIV